VAHALLRLMLCIRCGCSARGAQCRNNACLLPLGLAKLQARDQPCYRPQWYVLHAVAKAGQFPYVAALFYENGASYCTGSLISTRLVLTAGSRLCSASKHASMCTVGTVHLQGRNGSNMLCAYLAAVVQRATLWGRCLHVPITEAI
jgi:hypothetical protein